MSQTDPQTPAPDRLWLPGITAIMGALATLPWFMSFGPVTGEPGGLLAAAVTSGVIGILNFLAARRPNMDRPLQQALLLLGSSNVIIAGGHSLRLLHAFGFSAPPIPYLAEVSEFGIWALTLIALLRVPLRPVDPENRWRMALDLAIAFLGMAVIFMVIWMLPGLRNAAPAAKQRLMFYNWMEVGNLFVLNVVFVRGTVPKLGRAVRWLAAAVAMDTVYLVIFQYLTGLEYYDGRLLNSLFFVDVYLYLVAAFYFYRPPTVPDDAANQPAFSTKTNPLPILTVLGVGALLMLTASQSKTPAVMILSGGTVLITFLLLARVVASTRESLRLSRDKLEIEQRAQAQKMEAVGRLAGGVAHDFNNLLAVVMANSELALLGLSPGHPSRPDLEEIRRTAARGASLTGRLLSLGRRQNLQPKVVSPAALLHESQPVLQRTVGAAVRLTTQVLGEVGTICVDPYDFEQALINLAVNGRDAMPKAGGTVTITLQQQTLAQPLVSDYLSAPPGRYVVVTVSDNGAGMDAKTRARLFEPFFSTKEHGRGSGLGLSSVFAMVKSANGGIAIKSAPGQGTSIELWLPERTGEIAGGHTVSPKPDAVAAVAASGKPPTVSAGDVTILVVEDEPGVRVTVQRILENKGFVVLTAGDAQEARLVLTQPRARDVKLLLSDVIMPGQSGPALAADMVRERPNLKVLFMSGYTGDELRSTDFALAGSQLITKPFTAAELISRVSQVLGSS